MLSVLERSGIVENLGVSAFQWCAPCSLEVRVSGARGLGVKWAKIALFSIGWKSHSFDGGSDQ